MSSEEGRMEASSQAEALQQALDKAKEDMKEEKERAAQLKVLIYSYSRHPRVSQAVAQMVMGTHYARKYLFAVIMHAPACIC